MDTINLIHRAGGQAGRIAIRDGGREFTYGDLLRDSELLAAALLGGRPDLDEERIAFLIPGGVAYVLGQWAVWRAGGIAVPLNNHASLPEIEHILTTAGVTRALVAAEQRDRLADLCRRLGIVLLVLEQMSPDDTALPTVAAGRRAMILFTSGTTSKPKGVVTTHANIQAQMEALIEAWGWRADDRIPLFLPLHHIHGIVNVLGCGLWSGALVETFPAFDMDRILQRVAEGAYTVFMAVPTIYVKLIQHLRQMDPDQRQACFDGFARMRLMISGSAALPVEIHQAWQGLTGQVLLERYGMTEIGMGLSNPLHGERRPGAVGMPLPGVEIRLVAESGAVIGSEDEPGEIQVRGPAVFSEYWGDAAATEASFSEGWFRTGDMAVVEDGYYRIMGRLSVDIIKSGGYKLSALEIEDVLLGHPAISECAVVGVPDDTWGEAVAAAVVLVEGARLELTALREWADDRLSRYKLPKHLLVMDALPRNAMGKVTKPALKDLFT